MPKRLGLDELSDLKAALTGVEAKLTAAVDAAPTEPLAGAVREVIADLPNLRTTPLMDIDLGRPRVGGSAFIIDSVGHPGCILIGKRKGSHGEGKYATPGGHLEWGESWAESVTREIKEETDLDIPASSYSFVGVTNDVMGPERLHYITLFMTTSLPAGAVPVNAEAGKCEGWEWIPWTEVPSLNLFLPLRNFIALGMSPFTPLLPGAPQLK